MSAPKSPKPIRRKFIIGLLAIIVGVLGFGAAHHLAFVALDAGRTADAQREVLELLAAYCGEKQAWPKSWEDLATVSNSGKQHAFAWPAEMAEVRERVDVDFNLSLADVIKLNSGNFTHVRPRRFAHQLRPSEIEEFLHKLPAAANSKS